MTAYAISDECCRLLETGRVYSVVRVRFIGASLRGLGGFKMQ